VKGTVRCVPAPPVPPPTPVALHTADGVELAGDLSSPAAPRAAAIICHPHPQYGGNRFDHVVGALFAALPQAGVAALRFDFRHRYGGGVDEVLDADAAIAELRRRVRGVPIVAAGYSFGAMVVLAVEPTGLAGKILVAPPLTAMRALTAMRTGTADAVPGTPTLVLAAEHDQFTPASAAAPIVAAWPRAELVPIAMADHFLHGRTGIAADAAVAWTDELLGATEGSADG
jgi:alpha/beta superfamily hydrolase